jgi:hypothetical protein
LFRIAHPMIAQLEQQIRLAIVDALHQFRLTANIPFGGEIRSIPRLQILCFQEHGQCD